MAEKVTSLNGGHKFAKSQSFKADQAIGRRAPVARLCRAFNSIT